MTLDLKLDTASIDRVIEKLKNISFDVGELVDVLCEEGAAEANAAYRSWATAEAWRESEGEDTATGLIIAQSDTEDHLLIAEFGAGDATVNPADVFEEDELDGMVYRGSYSLEKGTQEYWNTGKWHFGKREYTRVEPHLGLYSAKQYLLSNSTRIAEEVMQSD